MVDHVKPKTAGTFKIEWPVVDKNALLRRALRDLEGDAEDGLFRLARTDIARAEEDEKIPAQVEGFDAVLVELEGLVVDRADEIFAGASGVGEDRSGFRIFFRLGEHEGCELLTREGARAVKEGALEIFIQRDVAGIERGKGQVMTVLKFFVVEVESSGGLAA